MDLNYADLDDDIDATTKRTRLHIACEQGDAEAVRSLIKKGANLNARDYRHCTPLFLAIRATLANPECYVICKLLLKNGALPTKLTKKNKNSVLHYLARGTLPSLFEIPKKSSMKIKKDKKAVEAPLFELISECISKGADVNKKNKHGATPLHLAALNGSHKTILFLIKKGASPLIKDKYEPSFFASSILLLYPR